MSKQPEIDDRMNRLADRLRGFQRERDLRTQLALEMLVKIEERVRTQRAALDQASARITQLEKERDEAVARAAEIVELYEGSLSNNDAFFKGIETLASRIVHEAGPAPKAAGSAPAAPPPQAKAPPPPPVVKPVAMPPPALRPPQAAGSPVPSPVAPLTPPTAKPAVPPLVRPNLVQGPSKTPFLREMAPAFKVQDRTKPVESLSGNGSPELSDPSAQRMPQS